MGCSNSHDMAEPERAAPSADPSLRRLDVVATREEDAVSVGSTQAVSSEELSLHSVNSPDRTCRAEDISLLSLSVLGEAVRAVESSLPAIVVTPVGNEARPRAVPEDTRFLTARHVPLPLRAVSIAKSYACGYVPHYVAPSLLEGRCPTAASGGCSDAQEVELFDPFTPDGTSEQV